MALHTQSQYRTAPQDKADELTLRRSLRELVHLVRPVRQHLRLLRELLERREQLVLLRIPHALQLQPEALPPRAPERL